jgi:hypothetical protein
MLKKSHSGSGVSSMRDAVGTPSAFAIFPNSTRELLETIIEHWGYRMLEEKKWTDYGYAPIIYAVSDAREQYRSIELGRLDKLLGFYLRTLEESVMRMLAADLMDGLRPQDAAPSS